MSKWGFDLMDVRLTGALSRLGIWAIEKRCLCCTIQHHYTIFVFAESSIRGES